MKSREEKASEVRKRLYRELDSFNKDTKQPMHKLDTMSRDYNLTAKGAIILTYKWTEGTRKYISWAELVVALLA